jgi:hypothetical protein
LGLLVEEQRTNLLLNSEDFSGATVFRGSITANVIAAPDGATTADLFTENTETGNHATQFGSVAFTTGVTYTVSIFLRPNGRDTNIRFRATNTTTFAAEAFFNLTGAGAVASTVFGTASIQTLPNGWYRCIITGVSGATATTGIQVITSSGAGDNTSGIYLWGAQLEAGAFPTSYIGPTTTAAVTRSADVCSIMGIDTASWYNHLEGTICTAVSYQGGNVTSNGAGYANGVLKFAEAGVSNFSRVIRLATQDTPDSHSLVQRNSTSSYLASENTIGDLQVGRVYRYSGSYVNNSTSGLAFVVDGGTVHTNSTAAAIPQATRLLIGRGNSGTVAGSPDSDNQYCNGTIRRITYWPVRLPNAQLQTITL